MTSVFY